MWINQVNKYRDKNSFIEVNSPSNNEEIVAAEEGLNIIFPKELKELLLQMNGDNLLLHSVQQIVENTIMTRRYLGECYEGLNQLLFIGGNGCGDYYCYIIRDGVIMSNKIIRWSMKIIDEYLLQMGSLTLLKSIIWTYVNIVDTFSRTIFMQPS